jgi:hypothetical protein
VRDGLGLESGNWSWEKPEEGRRRRGGRTYPFPFTVLMLLMCSAQICAIEPDNRDCEDYLYDAEDGVRDVGEGHFAATHDAHFGSCCVLQQRGSRGSRVIVALDSASLYLLSRSADCIAFNCLSVVAVELTLS